MPPFQSALRSASITCRVVIVDRHTAILEMTAQVVGSIPGFKVIGQARDAEGMRELCLREKPDVVVMDLVQPRGAGIGVLAELRTACPGTRVLIFSDQLRPALVRGALLSGAHGLVEKTAPLDEFCRALRAVGAGQVYFGRPGCDEIRNLYHGQACQRARLVRLTEREKTVLCAIADGHSSKEISAELGISVHTVVHHRSRLMKKTELRGVAQLSRYAVQMGLVDETVGSAPVIC